MKLNTINLFSCDNKMIETKWNKTEKHRNFYGYQPIIYDFDFIVL